MKFIADLHIHSPFSRATSKTSHLYGLASWASVKGIQVIGTGDFTHPGWLNHLVENLEPAEPGFYRLKTAKTAPEDNILPDGLQADISTIRFVLTSEISSIYKRGGRVRKVHNIVFAPDLDSVRQMNATLAGIGNIESDGRPILGLDSRDLLEIVLEKMPGGFLVPAHIWTPWFSLFGSKSGFDSIEECFGDLSDHIFALETGLSSDPAMNRYISSLDSFTLISNSDCHSPGKLGREANMFTTDFDFYAMQQAIRSPVDQEGKRHFDATVEFYPEEGKYHCDGHRKCGICLEPFETDKVKGICPSCSRPVTVGVLNRVMELADRSSPVYPQGSPKVHSLVPLNEILSELLGTGPATKRVMQAYVRLIQQFGSEFDILLQTPKEDLSRKASPILAEAIHRVRTGKVIRKPGYDGEFGVISVFEEGERSALAGQLNLFGTTPKQVRRKPVKHVAGKKKGAAAGTIKKKDTPIKELNAEQQRVVDSEAHHIIVKAGPGTGKTHTLVRRVIRLVQQKNTPCTVITFTNKAADELQLRIQAAQDGDVPVYVATLHGYCLRWLRHAKPDISVVGPDMRLRLLRILYEKSAKSIKELSQLITDCLQKAPDLAQEYPAPVKKYFRYLEQQNQIDIEAVIPSAANLLRGRGTSAAQMRAATGVLFIDEFQDLNQSQYELVVQLAETSPVFAIGDPDQAIYGFRGSSPTWFNLFAEKLDPEQHVLVTNYRSAAGIVAASYELILHNDQPFPSIRTQSAAADQGAIYLQRSSSPKDEALFVAGQIEALLGGTSHREIDRLKNQEIHAMTLSDIAILYRTSRQAKILAETLVEHGFPVQVVDITPFYRSGPAQLLYLWILAATRQAEISDILALLKHENRAGREELESLERFMPPGLQDPLSSLHELEGTCPDELLQLLVELDNFANQLRQDAEIGLHPVLQKIVARNEIDDENPDIIRFFQLAENFIPSIDAFGDHLRRYNDSVVYDNRAEAVTLMTMHAAKGLEFPVVFLVGLEEGILPLNARGDLSPAEQALHLQEERRLFYVGMSRAEKILYLSYAENRHVSGEMIQQVQSRFIEEIPAGYCRQAGEVAPARKKANRKVKQLTLF